MELTDAALLDLILAPRKPAVRKPARHNARRAACKPVYQAPIKRGPRCTCGVCATCQDEARWERIFQEKFADPTYYSQPLRRDSSLRW